MLRSIPSALRTDARRFAVIYPSPASSNLSTSARRMTVSHLAALPSPNSHSKCFSSNSSSPTPQSPPSPPAPLLRLENARLNSLVTTANPSPLNWIINDAGVDECWAIIAPASEAGGAVRRELISILSGQLRPRLFPSGLQQHPPTHPFLSSSPSPSYPSSSHPTSSSLQENDNKNNDDGVQTLAARPRSASSAIKHVSFATKMGSTHGTAGAGEFTNYSARYGAIREEDRITLYERLMDLLECPVGLIAAQKLLPDPFATQAGTESEIGLFKYRSTADRQRALERAQEADRVIKQMAPLLLIGEDLLHRPVIALSNGQTRRARILSSLIGGAELVILEEPFSGIDKDTRGKLTALFRELHGGRRPRLVFVLREQDEIPDLITHVLSVDDHGSINSVGPRPSSSSSSSSSANNSSVSPSNKAESSLPSKGGPELVYANSKANIGTSDTATAPLITLNSVSIQYGDKKVLDDISLSIHPGLRLVLAGDNGSGKTTLLALLLGDHPKSFSFPVESLSLFSHARDHPSNARLLLNRRIGHLSPELFNAFPRRSIRTGGLSVGEVVASGFENVFARRAYTPLQKQRVFHLLSLFSDLIKLPPSSASTRGAEEDGGGVEALSSRGFSELTHGSQAVVLFLRSVISNPSLLVLDEPFQGMDKKQVQRTRDFLDHPENYPIGQTTQDKHADLQQRKKMAIVLVSHYESEWPTSFGSLIRLKDGKVVEKV